MRLYTVAILKLSEQTLFISNNATMDGAALYLSFAYLLCTAVGLILSSIPPRKKSFWWEISQQDGLIVAGFIQIWGKNFI